MGGGAWPFLVGGAICLVNSDNERDSSLLNRRSSIPVSQGPPFPARSGRASVRRGVVRSLLRACGSRAQRSVPCTCRRGVGAVFTTGVILQSS